MSIELTSIVGFVDRIADGFIVGWALDLSSRDEPVEVALFLDGEQVASQVTSLPRPDVAWKFDATVNAGFSFPIPYRLIRSRRFALEIRVPSHEVTLPASAEVRALEKEPIELERRDGDLIELHASIHEDLKYDADALLRLNHNPVVQLRGLDPDLATIWIINGAKGTHAEYFRTYALARALHEAGFTALIFDLQDVPFLKPSHQKACFFVRVALDDRIAGLLKLLKRAKVPVVSDFDDLIFRPSLIHRIDGVRFLTREQTDTYAKGMGMYRQMLEASDLVCLTTEHLRKEASAFNTSTFVLRNYPLPQARLAAARVRPTARRSAPDPAAGITVGYYSGTLTHQADLKTCSLGIARYLSAFPTARFRLVGKVDLAEFPELQDLDNLDRVDLMPYADMIADLAQCDVVIAPLQVGDPFCESKSELKWFDAALVHVPVIASPTGVFREVIEHGVTGLLANTATEWFEALQRLTLEPSLRERMADAAHAAVQKLYSSQAQCQSLRDLLGRLGVARALTAEPTTPVVQRPLPTTTAKPRAAMPRLVLLLPDITPGSGGHRKALTWCHHYARMGGRVTVLFMSPRTDSELREIVERYFFADCGDVRAYDGMEPAADVAVATSWPTAYAIARWTSVPRRCYFVQDFEPMFSPMSTDYVLAYHSYRLGLQPIVFGDWNSRMLKKEFGVATRGIRFPVDREIYSPVAGVQRENIILFYARPSQPRRLYELGYHALRQLRAFLPGYRFVFFGEDIPGLAVDGFECVGKQTDLGELAKLYSKARIGLAFSSTNPSLIPYEMLSCGLPVVDITLGQESDDFAGCSALVRCPPTVEDVMRELFRLAEDVDRCRQLSEQALAWADTLPNDLQYAQSVLAELGLMTGTQR